MRTKNGELAGFPRMVPFPGRWRLIVTAVVMLVWSAMLVAGPVSARTGSGQQWYHGRGMAVHRGVAGTLTRGVEAWVATDGEYVVVVTSPETGAHEVVSFDGSQQTAVVVDPSGHSSRVRGRSPAHFLFAGATHPGLSAVGVVAASDAGVVVRQAMVDDATGLPQRTVAERPDGLTTTVEMTWEPAAGPPVAGLAGGSTAMEQTLTSQVPSAGVMASGSNSRTFSSIYGGPCVYAYNYRNTGSGFFYGSSSQRGDCLSMDVTLGKGATDGAGYCTMLAWLGSGPTSTGYSTKGVTTQPVTLSPTCSSHAGWLSDWSLVVAWKGLDTSV